MKSKTLCRQSCHPELVSGSILEAVTPFLVQAKQATYASGKKAEASLSGGKQFEFISDDFCYRDIYFGEQFFVGQEIVYFKNSPIWSMCYSGGLMASSDIEVQKGVYAFLKEALKNVPREFPVRGPSVIEYEKLKYKNEIMGELGRFCGFEEIYFEENVLYQLHYAGGLIK